MDDKRRIFILDIINAALMFAQGTWFWHVSTIKLILKNLVKNLVLKNRVKKI